MSEVLRSINKVPIRLWFLLGMSVAGIFLILKRRRAAKDYGAFHHYLTLSPPQSKRPNLLPLSRCNFGLQDIFDVEWFVTGFGSPEWERTHEAAKRTAVAIGFVIQAGATCIGKTTMDELGYSLFGRNRHYGTPENPAAPLRLPGGSSSGSAVAVAANLVDFAIGIDTVGNVRIPAAFCGILGYRASHGTVPMAGVTAVATTLDAVGWFAKDPTILRHVGDALLQLPTMDPPRPKRFYIADDLFSLSSLSTVRTLDVLARAVQTTLGRSLLHHMNLGEYMAHNISSIQAFVTEFDRLGMDTSNYTSIDALRDSMLLVLRFEFKSNHKEWISKMEPELTPEVDERVKRALENSPEGLRLIAQRVREEARVVLNHLLKNDIVLVLPSTPGFPPKLLAQPEELGIYETRAHTLLSIATMSGCCQVTIPVGKMSGVPISVSMLARHGGDRFLLDTVVLLYTTIQQEVKNQPLWQ